MLYASAYGGHIQTLSDAHRILTLALKKFVFNVQFIASLSFKGICC